MIRVKQSITINRPVDEVFRFMTEAGNIFKYSRSIEEIRQLTRDDIGVGARFEIVSRFLGRSIPLVLEVTEFEPNRKIASRSIGSKSFDILGTTEFEVLEGGFTKVTSQSQIVAKGLWRLLEPLLPGMIRRRSDAEYAKLREVLETSLHEVDSQMDVVNISKTIVMLEP